MTQIIEGWHFMKADHYLGYGDGRKVVAGDTLSVDFPYEYWSKTYDAPTLCHAGLHCSELAIDALNYAPGLHLARVNVWGEVVIGSDKACGRHREALWIIDATDVVLAWTRWCALEVAHLWDAPQVWIDWAHTGDYKLLEAARAAARGAARVAALVVQAAARDAQAAARDAQAAAQDALDAVQAATRGAAWDAALCAALAARDAPDIKKKQNEYLEMLLWVEHLKQEG